MTTHRPARAFREVPRAALAALLATALIAGGGTPASAQHPTAGHRVAVGGDRLVGVTTVSPSNGPPGTVVAVRAQSLPPGTPVQVMIGALQSGFEVVAITVTDEAGNLSNADSVGITLPDWVQSDRSYLFMVTDRSYHPLAAADVFHPTDANGMVQRAGRIMYEPTDCPALTNQAEELYFLAGDPGEVKPGEEVVVEGPIVKSEVCGPGVTIDVRQLRRPAVR